MAYSALPAEASTLRAAEIYSGRLESISDPEDRARFRDDILSARNEGLFTPPGRRNTIQMPGNNGGANWGGAAVDPQNGKLIVVSKDLPCLLKLDPDKNQTGNQEEQEAHELRYLSGFSFMIASNGLSAIATPWTSLTAYDSSG